MSISNLKERWCASTSDRPFTHVIVLKGVSSEGVGLMELSLALRVIISASCCQLCQKRSGMSDSFESAKFLRNILIETMIIGQR